MKREQTALGDLNKYILTRRMVAITSRARSNECQKTKIVTVISIKEEKTVKEEQR